MRSTFDAGNCFFRAPFCVCKAIVALAERALTVLLCEAHTGCSTGRYEKTNVFFGH